MSRRRSASETMREAKAKRRTALERLELRNPPTPRSPPSGPTSFPLKVPDPELSRLVAEFEAKKESALATQKP